MCGSTQPLRLVAAPPVLFATYIVQSRSPPILDKNRLVDKNCPLAFEEASIIDKSKCIDICNMKMRVANKHTDAVAQVFHALSDETRLRILQRLQGGEQCVCDLTDAFQTGQSRLSFHLKVLKDAGLVRDRPEGRWMYYSVNAEAFEDLEQFLADLKKATQRSSAGSKCC